MALATQTKGRTAAPPAPPKPQRISMNPDTFVQGGGGINDIDVSVTDTGTCVFDWGGQAPPDTPALAIEFTDDNGGTHNEYLSCGPAADWQPDELGEGLVPQSGKTAIVDSTNLGMFLRSLIDAGFPKEMFDDGNLKVIIGCRVHVIRKTIERQGLIRRDDRKKAPTVLLVDKLYSLPGSETASAPKPATGKAPVNAKSATAASTVKPNGKATPVQADDLDEQIVTALKLYLAKQDGPVPAKEIAKAVFEHFNANDMKALANKAVSRSSNQELRKSLNDNGFVYDGSTLALAEE